MTPTVAATTHTDSTGTYHCWQCHPVLPRQGCLAPFSSTLGPDHEGRGDCSQQVLLTRRQNLIPNTPLGPTLPAQAMLHHQETQHLLLDAELPCPQVCPNKLLNILVVLCPGHKKALCTPPPNSMESCCGFPPEGLWSESLEAWL